MRRKTPNGRNRNTPPSSLEYIKESGAVALHEKTKTEVAVLIWRILSLHLTIIPKTDTRGTVRLPDRGSLCEKQNRYARQKGPREKRHYVSVILVIFPSRILILRISKSSRSTSTVQYFYQKRSSIDRKQASKRLAGELVVSPLSL